MKSLSSPSDEIRKTINVIENRKKEKVNPKFEVIITYDIKRDEDSFYKAIHDPLGKEQHGFEQVTKSTYLFPDKLTEEQIENLKAAIVKLYNKFIEDKKDDTSIIKLIVACQAAFKIVQVIPESERVKKFVEYSQ